MDLDGAARSCGFTRVCGTAARPEADTRGGARHTYNRTRWFTKRWQELDRPVSTECSLPSHSDT